MRKIVVFVLIFISLAVLFSCKKNNNGTVTGGTITATVNGTTFVSASVSEQANPYSNASAVSFINVFTATDSSKTREIILYLDSLTPATYSYDSGYSNALQYFNNGLSYGTYPGSKGSIIISPIGTTTNTISGTFSGVARFIGNQADTVIITNGVFTNCAY